MTTITSQDPAAPPPLLFLRKLPARIVLALVLVALGDWLLRGPSGSSLLLLVFAIALAAALTNAWHATSRTLLLAGLALLLGALPLAESVGAFPLAFAFGGLAISALLLTAQGTPGWLRKPIDAALLLLSGPRRLLGDALDLGQAASRTGWGRSLFSVGRLAGWIVPLGLLGVFALLFADANPVLQRWLFTIDPAIILSRLEPARILLWGAILLLVWPFLRVRLAAAGTWRRFMVAMAPPAPQGAPAQVASEPSVPWRDLLLGREAIARSLVLFNLLFALQTGLDAIYLWGGADLPSGMNYAGYAHRGAYPLIVTALLAAAFMLAAMRPGGPAQNAPLLRGLLYVFVAQNVGLVLSSILRLDLYVSVYSLTYWRIAAFIWMGLVAVGLVLIGVRVVLGQSNRWLIGANLAAATATLYCCCFVNFAGLIADYNVAHQPETERRLDLAYLASLGPEAIPAIDRLIPTASTDVPAIPSYKPAGSRRDWIVARRDWLAQTHRYEMTDWRHWTYRRWRLSSYLAEHPAPRLDVAPAAPMVAPVETPSVPR